MDCRVSVLSSFTAIPRGCAVQEIDKSFVCVLLSVATFVASYLQCSGAGHPESS